MRRISIRTLDISTRTRNALLRSKIEYLDDLVNMSDKDIMLKTPIGEKGIKEVRAVIKKYQEENRSNCIEIEGVVETNVDHQTFLDKFIEWVEINGWSFGGITREVNEEGHSVVTNKLSEIKGRALRQNNDSTLRHDPNETDIKIANKNFEDLEEEVYGNALEKSKKELQTGGSTIWKKVVNIVGHLTLLLLVLLCLASMVLVAGICIPSKVEGKVISIQSDEGIMYVNCEYIDKNGVVNEREIYFTHHYYSHIKEGDYIKKVVSPFCEKVTVNNKVIELGDGGN